MGDGTVWISEDTEWDEHEDTFLTGAFSGYHDTGRMAEEFEGLTVEAAVEWGRARADRVYVQHDGEHYSAGTEHPPEFPLWPPPNLPDFVWRREPADAWKDRTDADPPIAWAVTAWVSPDDDRIPEPSDDEPLRAVAERAGARFDLDQLTELRAQLASARDSTYILGRMAYRMRLEVPASTAAQAQSIASERLSLPDGWEPHFEVAPQDGARPSA
ncbi:hypothetical protein OJ997_00235 [Solirubrobacter phytolaccae]|uniref:Uncharacterized protein n=1 Tax=Solirubrobacter phytolaccae TaxID=1404360 RepID=A0A9X3N2M7_9ACTN|nr:hypothetical protein [Solirubrobacter phytolaccae]MDA0178705.1 hypothetical protein [Solirubrobacter phytolaccae]